MNSEFNEAVSVEQQETARLLDRLLGSTFADRYLDFCRLASGSTGLRVSRPLAAHALRELDSSLRQSLKVPFELSPPVTAATVERAPAARTMLLELGYDEDRIQKAIDALNPVSTHQIEILSIVKRLDMAPDGDVAKTWIRLCRTFGKAHERSFHRTLTVDDKFRDEFQRPFDTVLRAAMLGLQRQYSALTQRVEQIAAMTDVIHALSLYEKEIPNALPLQWLFFGRLQGPAWLAPLKAHGLLAPPVESMLAASEGELRLRSWPQGAYLLRMAASPDSDTRARVGAALSDCALTDNRDVIRTGFEILAAIPAAESAPLADIAANWLDTDIQRTLAGTPERYLKNLAEAGARDAALRFAQAFFTIVNQGGAITTRFDRYLYEHALLQLVAPLAACCGMDALTLFSDLLDQVAVIEKFSGSHDFSDMTLQSITDERDAQGDIYSALILAVRKTAEIAAAEQGGLPAVAALLSQHRPKIFRRIALHIVAQHPERAPEFAQLLLTDPDLIESDYARAEYSLLARTWFPHLLPQVRSEILDTVDSIPEKYRGFWKQRFKEQRGREPSLADEQDYENHTLYELCWQWRDVLPADRQERMIKAATKAHDALDSRHALLTEADANTLSISEITARPIEDLLQTILAYRPPNDASHQTVSPLSDALRTAAEQAPERFGEAAQRFAVIPPFYIAAILQGLSDAARNKKALPWKAVLPLILQVFNHLSVQEGPTVQDDERDQWRASVLAAAQLLASGLRRGVQGFEYTAVDTLHAAVLAALNADPKWSKSGDDVQDITPDTFVTAQRTIRGCAVELCLLFIWWSNIHGQSPFAGAPGQAFEVMKEFSGALANELRDTSDRGVIPRAVLGRYLSWIYHFGKNWLLAQIDKLLPPDNPVLREATWNAHLVHDQHPILESILELDACYIGEISALTAFRKQDRAEHRRTRLAGRLLGFYLSGTDEARAIRLLEPFWANAPASLRCQVLWLACQELRRKDLSSEIRQRVLAYWDMRLNRAEVSSDREPFRLELCSIGQWFQFSEIDSNWLMDELLRMLSLGFAPSMSYVVLERLSNIAADQIDRAVEVLTKLLTSEKIDKSFFFASSGPIRNVLTRGKASGNPETVKTVDELVSFLASHGVHEYLDVLEAP